MRKPFVSFIIVLFAFLFLGSCDKDVFGPETRSRYSCEEGPNGIPLDCPEFTWVKLEETEEPGYLLAKFIVYPNISYLAYINLYIDGVRTNQQVQRVTPSAVIGEYADTVRFEMEVMPFDTAQSHIAVMAYVSTRFSSARDVYSWKGGEVPVRKSWLACAGQSYMFGAPAK